MTPSLKAWEDLLEKIKHTQKKITVGLIVKYRGTSEPYISVIEALKSAGYFHDYALEIIPIDANALEDTDKSSAAHQQAMRELQSVQGIVVPGGFDKRGIEGKIIAAQWAREHKIPYLGLCLGMQVMLIEAARNLLGLTDATSMEFAPATKHPVIALLNEQNMITEKGGTMRLGSYPCALTRGTAAYNAYKQDRITERHRHRYEFNNRYTKEFEEHGVVFSGINPERNLVEISEIKGHPFMVGTQAHPEFLSSPLKPHPLFVAFIQACLKKSYTTR
jgi:CTP synthase